MQGSVGVGEVSSSCSSVASTSKTVWLLPFAESPAAFRGEQHNRDLHSRVAQTVWLLLREVARAAFAGAAQLNQVAHSLTMDAAQHGVRDVERVPAAHDEKEHKATSPPSRLGRGLSLIHI